MHIYDSTICTNTQEILFKCWCFQEIASLSEVENFSPPDCMNMLMAISSPKHHWSLPANMFIQWGLVEVFRLRSIHQWHFPFHLAAYGAYLLNTITVKELFFFIIPRIHLRQSMFLTFSTGTCCKFHEAMNSVISYRYIGRKIYFWNNFCYFTNCDIYINTSN